MMSPELFLLLVCVFAVGLFAGFVGGLFGIGGGVVIVPALYVTFGFFDVPDDIRIKLAVGTSLATIIITSWRSVRTHYKHGVVDVELLKSWAPYIAAGAVLGALLARYLQAEILTFIFAIGILLVATQKLWSEVYGSAKTSDDKRSAVPGGLARSGMASFVGLASSLMGIGGGVMGVIILTSFGRSIHQAIATAAGFGLAIAVPGSIGFLLAGLGEPDLPLGSLGYVSIPAFAAISAMTIITAPIGARVAHRLDQKALNLVFVGYLVLTAILLLRDVIAG